jgi:hypothetical protein
MPQLIMVAITIKRVSISDGPFEIFKLNTIYIILYIIYYILNHTIESNLQYTNFIYHLTLTWKVSD